MRTISAVISIFISSLHFIGQAADIRPIEDGIIEIDYIKHSVKDTTRRDSKFTETPMKLRIGKSMAMFFSVKRMWADSLRYYNLELYANLSIENERNHGGLMKGHELETIYTNFPDGKISVIGNFDMELWEYNENLILPNWKIQQEVKQILGLDCQKATTNYKGRVWTAWFCTEIPVNYGPWKLHGLPGAILEAYDSNKDYIFYAESIRTINIPKVGYYQYNRATPINISRDKYFNNWYKTINKDSSFYIRQAFGYTKSGEKPKQVTANYDFEETDYPHE